MTKDKLEHLNKISNDMDKLERVAKYKCGVESAVLKDVIELIGDDFYALVSKKWGELNDKFKQL